MSINRGATPTLVNDSNWINDVWDGMFLDRWYAESVIPKLTNTRIQEKIKSVGQQMHFRIEPEATVTPHIKDMPIQWSAVKAEKRSLSVDYAYSAAHRMDDQDLAQLSELPVMERVASSITKKHAEKEHEVFFSAVPLLSFNPLNVVNTGAAVTGTRGSANYVINQLAKMRTLFNRRRAPKVGRYVVVSPEVEELLITSDQTTFNISGQPTKAIEDGEWGIRVCGFDVVVSEFVVGTGAAGNPFLCICGCKEAIGFGRQVTKMETNIQLQDFYGKGVRALNSFGFGLLYPDGMGLWTVLL